jgi:hypothetical protein
MITDGEVTARGVVPPESAYDPDRFFEELGKRGIVVNEEFEEL